MSVLPVRLFGDPVLRRKSRPVANISQAERQLVEDMMATMTEAEGVGLAAPQVGVSKRVILARLDKETVLPVINPEITQRSAEAVVAVEGCLSIPGFQADVERSLTITLKGQDADGNRIEMDLSEFPARVVQHEVDHLDGKLYIDQFVPETLSAISYEDDEETGEEQVVLTPVTLEELRSCFAKATRVPTATR
ncbi:MAG: peptide deformylase [Armatimonadetes bacterium]|nr:peptide deformylase [Armatimonadota bacterium]